MYKYETHMHTCQGSACGTSTGAEHARFYKEQGYQGIFITDHFFGGNTAAPRSGKWKDRVDHYCSGFEDAWNEGQKIGLDVFFGIEQNFEGDEYLIFGLDKQYLLDHPEIERWTRKEQYENVRAAGGCVIQAHPFRMRGYLNAIRVCDLYADGIEVANAGNTQPQDAYAARYCKARGIYTIAGSDNHKSHEGCKLFGVGLDTPIDSIDDWVAHILQKQPHQLIIPEGRFDGDPTVEPLIPSYWYDEEEKFVDLPMDWME